MTGLYNMLKITPALASEIAMLLVNIVRKILMCRSFTAAITASPTPHAMLSGTTIIANLSVSQVLFR